MRAPLIIFMHKQKWIEKAGNLIRQFSKGLRNTANAMRSNPRMKGDSK